MQTSIDLLNNLKSFLPETVLLLTIIITLVADLILKRKSPFVGILGIIGLVITGIIVAEQFGIRESLFFNMVVIDPYSVFFKELFVLSTIFVILFAMGSEEIRSSMYKNEYVYLFLSLTFGAFLMSSSVNMLMMYLSLELASLTSYILAGYTKKVKRSTEAAMKYIIYGAASSGIMIYGMSLLYGYTGTMNIYGVAQFLSTAASSNTLVTLSIILIVAGFGYKISSVPFHFWTPDVYEGSPIPVTAFLAVTSSAAGFAILIRFFATTFAINVSKEVWELIPNISWTEVIIVLSVASMIIGNFVAIWQSSLKRLLAYSSIAQSGYIMLGLVVANKSGLTAMMIYLIAYLFMNLGAFYVTLLIFNKLGTDDIDEMKGLGYRAPVIGVAMAIFMFALSGIPATAGFIGKFYLFAALLETGKNSMIVLAIIGLINSVISLYFYIKVLKNMYLKSPEGDTSKLLFSVANYVVLLLLAVPTIVFGIYFYPLIKFAENSAILFWMR
ncbi:MAG: NADH-quinone oxidoreductase subunit N [Ignavibacteria bacterium]